MTTLGPRRRPWRTTVALVMLVAVSCGTEAEPADPSVESSPSASTSSTSAIRASDPSGTPASSAASTETVTPAPSTVPATSPSAVPSTVPATSPSAAPGSLSALEVLALVPVAREQGAGYDRELFEHWVTQPGGCSTREAVLIRDSLTFAQVDPFGCKVVAGDWYSAYDGATWQDPADVDIDHVVALKEAWDSGAWAWSAQQRRDYANDLTDVRTLRAVTDSINQSKGDKDPSNWMPPLEADWCRYLADWIAVKARWQLSMDESEAGRIRNLVRDRCPGLVVAPWTPPAE